MTKEDIVGNALTIPSLFEITLGNGVFIPVPIQFYDFKIFHFYLISFRSSYISSSVFPSATLTAYE